MRCCFADVVSRTSPDFLKFVYLEHELMNVWSEFAVSEI